LIPGVGGSRHIVNHNPFTTGGRNGPGTGGIQHHVVNTTFTTDVGLNWLLVVIRRGQCATLTIRQINRYIHLTDAARWCNHLQSGGIQQFDTVLGRQHVAEIHLYFGIVAAEPFTIDSHHGTAVDAAGLWRQVTQHQGLHIVQGTQQAVPCAVTADHFHGCRPGIINRRLYLIANGIFINHFGAEHRRIGARHQELRRTRYLSEGHPYR
tara:strand:- start:46639 stop:47265 length:627 start_codon:yes stop_codon:yes gene_type:complete